MRQVRVLRLPNNLDLPLPSRQTSGSAGFDLASAEPDFVLAPGERRLVSTGLAIELPPGIEGQVRPRSGLALRHGITMPNAPGTIDSDYRGELRVILQNSGTAPVTKTIPVFSLTISLKIGGSLRLSQVGICVLSLRITMA